MTSDSTTGAGAVEAEVIAIIRDELDWRPERDPDEATADVLGRIAKRVAALATARPDESLERLRELSEAEHNSLLVKARRALRPFASRVFNDNGELSVSTQSFTAEEIEAAYFSSREIDAALSRPSQTAGVAEGYALVPVEPPDDRIKEAVQFALKASLSNDYPWPDYMRDLYRILTRAAAPQTEGVER